MAKPYKDIKPLEILRNRVCQINDGIIKRLERKNKLDAEINELKIMQTAFEEAMEILAEAEDEGG